MSNLPHVFSAFDARQRSWKNKTNGMTLGLCSVVSAVGVWAAPGLELKTALGVLSFGAALTGDRLIRQAQRDDDYVTSWDNISRQTVLNQVYQDTNQIPEAKGTTVYHPVLFDLERLTNRNLFPVLIIAGVMGSGKTTIARYLAAKGGGGTSVFVSPHANVNDKEFFDKVVGFAKEDDAHYISTWSSEEDGMHGEWEDSPYQWDQLVKSQMELSIFAALESFNNEFDRRMVVLAKDPEALMDPIDLFLDEAVAIAGFMTKGPYRKYTSPWWTRWIRKMLTEPRKTGLRLWVLTQEGTVEVLGAQGMGRLKNSIPWIRLGQLGFEHCQTEMQKKHPEVWQWYAQKSSQDSRSVCWVSANGQELPALVPGLEEQLEFLGNRPVPEAPKASKPPKTPATYAAKTAQGWETTVDVRDFDPGSAEDVWSAEVSSPQPTKAWVETSISEPVYAPVTPLLLEGELQAFNEAYKLMSLAPVKLTDVEALVYRIALDFGRPVSAKDLRERCRALKAKPSDTVRESMHSLANKGYGSVFGYDSNRMETVKFLARKFNLLKRGQ